MSITGQIVAQTNQQIKTQLIAQNDTTPQPTNSKWLWDDDSFILWDDNNYILLEKDI